ncbi:MAG: helix-turn-helix domain-containing protein [Streptosporangiaceae bacterium]|nr:helix-turn-helix domain-containing protein [Streptosporangiaceae bacterium]
MTAFACALRALRRSAGEPTYAALAKRTGASASALSEAARGRRLANWATVEAFVRGCGADPQAWRRQWEAARGQPAQPEAPAPQEAGAEDHSVPATLTWRRRKAVAAAGVPLVLLVGVLAYTQVPSASPAPAASRSVTTLPWTRVTGPGCGNNTDGAQNDVDRGWRPAGGGWTGNGCGGKSVTARLSGSPTFWDRTVGWTFEPKARGTCRLDARIPDIPGATGVATYRIFGKDPSGELISAARIAQALHRGRWVTLGTYHFPDGVINVELGNVGPGTALIAADAVRATCR